MMLSVAILVLALVCASAAFSAFSFKMDHTPGESECEKADSASQEKGAFRYGMNHALAAALLLLSAFLPQPYELYGGILAMGTYVLGFALLFFGILWKPVTCIDGKRMT